MTTGRVHRAIATLGYRQNLAASSLRRADRKTAAIGLLVDDVSNPFSAALHRGVETEAGRRHVAVFAGSNDDDAGREGEVLSSFLSRQVDGVIAMPTGLRQSPLLAVLHSRRPLVCIDRPAGAMDADTVTVDNRGGMQAAVQHLATRGHRRIGYVGDLRSIWTAEERYAGFVEGLASCGLRLHRRLVRREVRDSEGAERAVGEMLATAEPPTAVLTGRNLLTLGAVSMLQQRGLSDRVALVGFDDFPAAELLQPPVTVIAQDPLAVGQEAARLLFARLDGLAGPPRHVVLPTRLVVRGSDVPAPVRGRRVSRRR